MIRTRQTSETWRLLAVRLLAARRKQPGDEGRMTPVVAGTAIGAAALTVGRGALGAVSNSLSFAAQLVGAASGNSPSQADAKSKQASADQAALKLRTDEMRQRISRQLAAAGIQLCEPVEMVTSGTGGIAVAGPHPQQAAIEEVLSSDVLLERDFNQLASDYSDLAEQGRGGDLPPTLTIAIAQASPLAR